MRTWSFGQKKHWVAIHNPWQNQELNDLMTRLWDSEYPLGDLPVLVISQDTDGNGDDATIDEFYEKYQSQFLTLSRNSRQVLSKDAGHELHIYAPELCLRIDKGIGGINQARYRLKWKAPVK